MSAPAVFGILTGINKSFPVRLDELVELAVILVITASFVGQDATQGMMEIIIPLAVEAVAAKLARANQARVVGGAFRE